MSWPFPSTMYGVGGEQDSTVLVATPGYVGLSHALVWYFRIPRLALMLVFTTRRSVSLPIKQTIDMERRFNLITLDGRFGIGDRYDIQVFACGSEFILGKQIIFFEPWN